MVSGSHTSAVVVFVLVAATELAAATTWPTYAEVERMRTFMRELRAESRIDAQRIEDAYRDALDRIPADRWALAWAWRDGRIAGLPQGTAHNVRLRLSGLHPIGEKDLRHQRLYVGADPAAVGLLLHVASRVRSGPLEVTSLVRHADYQRELLRTNPNAATPVPTHALGVAFDISILHASPDTARELRDVLRQMRADGDLFFVAEWRQVVFHVVVHPGRALFYRAVVHGQRVAPLPTLAHPPRLPTPLPIGPVLAKADARGGSAAAAVLATTARPAAYLTVGMLVAIRRWRRRRRVAGSLRIAAAFDSWARP